MPTNRTRRTRTQHVLDDLKIKELHEGPGACLLAGMGYYQHPTWPGAVKGEPQGFYWELDAASQERVREEMRRDWQLHRERVLSAWTGEGEPWAAREFGG